MTSSARGAVAAGLLWFTAGACMSFSPIRPATVSPGVSFSTQMSLTTSPGASASWFWDYSDEAAQNRSLAGVDMLWMVGSKAASTRPKSLGLGINGIEPYIDGYMQTRTGVSPAGVGLRVGGMAGWWTEQVYWRVDHPLAGGNILSWSPSILYHRGNSPNGENPGSFLGFAQGLGLIIGRDVWKFVPSASVVLARADHRSYTDPHGASWTVFATAGVGLCVCGTPARP